MLMGRGLQPMGRVFAPLGELDRLRREMDKIFGQVGAGNAQPAASGVFPPVNVHETEAGYVLTAEMPGVEPGDLDVSVQGKTVTIKGRRKAAEDLANAKHHRRERLFGEFSRALGLPEELDAEKVNARLANGVLRLELPKAVQAQPKKIMVNG